MTDWISASEAARRLGIKQASLYAYVSRGVLSRRREADGRTSMFDADEVEELARKGRPRRTGGLAELVIESEITELTSKTQRYRGYDATDLAMHRRFEDVALLLWTGSLPGSGEPEPREAELRVSRPGQAWPADGGPGPLGWHATAAALAAGRAAQAALPAETLPLERLQVIVPALAATDQFRLHLDRPAVVAAGMSLIAGMIGALPERAVGFAERLPNAGGAELTARSGSIAARLSTKLCSGPVPRGLIPVLNAGLVLVADHELAASTLAARVAASMRADPYAVVATGLGAMGGALHGGAA